MSSGDTVTRCGHEGADVDLADFLQARIAEDEAVARQLGQMWALVAEGDRSRLDSGVREGMDAVFSVADGAPADSAPSRLVAELDAKRQIVARVTDVARASCAVCDEVLALLALPYARHPDYREEWRPDADRTLALTGCEGAPPAP